MIKAIIIDDEPIAVDILRTHASKIEDLNVAAHFNDPLQAIDYLRNNYVDFLFLDVNMPEISGLGLLKELKVKPLVVFTTAYEKYAVESYKFEAIDYLLKPIDFEDFQNAVNKVRKAVLAKKDSNLADSYIFIKDGWKTIKLFFEDILFFKGSGNYVEFITKSKKYSSRITINELMGKLPQQLFARVHNSYIINFEKINKIENNQIVIENSKIPIGESYKKSFLERIENRLF